MEIKIPNLGDGIDSAVVLSILVSEGDTLKKDQTLLELETDKAVAPVPSPVSGKIKTLVLKEGDAVSTGTLIATIQGDEKEAIPESSPKSSPASQPLSAESRPPTPPVSPSPSTYRYSSPSGAAVPASPYLKKIAREIGLDLSLIQGSGHGGRVKKEDVQQFIAMLQTQYLNPQPLSAASSQSEQAQKTKSLDRNFSKWGKIEIQKVSSLRKKIATKMLESWQTIPHVTQFDQADISTLMGLRKTYNPAYEKKGAKLTLTAFVLKAITSVLKDFPQFNASYDQEKGELIYKQYYHIGVAVDTEAGLIVPVIRDVDQKDLLTLMKELNELAQKARTRNIQLEDLQGGTFTISNLGGLGVGGFTPIINAPEVAILGIGRGEEKPVYTNQNKIDSRLMMPLALSYDHRIIDGGDGARFIRSLAKALETFDESLIRP